MTALTGFDDEKIRTLCVPVADSCQYEASNSILYRVFISGIYMGCGWEKEADVMG